MHHLHINPSEIEQLEFYEYQYTINNLVEHLKNEKEGHKEQEERSAEQYSNLSSSMQNSNGIKGANKYMKGINASAGLKTSGLNKTSFKIPKM
jgi:hypothetical protein